MRPLMFVLIVLSLIVLGAHFLRAGSWWFTLGVLGLVPFLLIRRAWVARLIQIVLVFGAMEWIRTLVTLASLRSQQGGPVGRMVVILGLVAAATLGSALLLQTHSLKRVYGHGE